PAPATMKTRPIDGFFVYRLLGLVGCNILIMKRVLLLFVLILCTKTQVFIL
ncbi:uncharacterized protein METZ01_LOCUS168781, partial [marine metagenome]